MGPGAYRIESALERECLVALWAGSKENGTRVVT